MTTPSCVTLRKLLSCSVQQQHLYKVDNNDGNSTSVIELGRFTEILLAHSLAHGESSKNRGCNGRNCWCVLSIYKMLDTAKHFTCTSSFHAFHSFLTLLHYTRNNQDSLKAD